MLRSAILHVVMSLVFTGLGLAAGWRIWRPKPADPAATAPAAHTPSVSPQARRNLGIVMGEIKATPWTRIARFPATLEMPLAAETTLRAPAAGSLLEVRRRAGAVVAAGENIATFRVDSSGETISLTAPAGPPDWDLVEQKVSPGEHVQAGADIFVLRDLRTVRVRAESGGDDASVLLAALKSGTPCDATPLLEGNGPALKELKLLSAENAPGARMTRVIAEVPNEPLSLVDEGGGHAVRTWSLRPGQKYVLRVPLETVKRAYVVPSDAIAEDGPDLVVFLQSGDTFVPQRVVVLYRDSEIAVLDARGSTVAPGDVYVERGAFALSLALRAGNNAIGHTHPH